MPEVLFRVCVVKREKKEVFLCTSPVRIYHIMKLSQNHDPNVNILLTLFSRSEHLSPNDTHPQPAGLGYVPVCVVKEREKWEVCFVCPRWGRFYHSPNLSRNHVFPVNEL